MSDNEDSRGSYGWIVARAWTDPASKRRLLADPDAMLAEAGIMPPTGTKFRIVEDTDAVTHLVLARPPAGGELSGTSIVARASTDPDFKARLLADPDPILAQLGVTPPTGTRLKIIEDTEAVTHMVLPRPPTGDELSDAELERVAGGCSNNGCADGLCTSFHVR